MKTYFDHERLNVYPEAIAFSRWVGDLECAGCIDVLGARKLIGPERMVPAKEQLVRIVNMLLGMLKRFSEHEHAGSLREEEGVYRVEQEHDQEQGRR